MLLLIALIAAVYYVVIPSGLAIGGTIALVLAGVAAAVALLASGPGVFLTARLTASRRFPMRLAGWGGLAVTTIVGMSAAAATGVLALLGAGAALAVPQFLPDWF